MRLTLRLLSTPRKPMIKFLGKRSIPKHNIDPSTSPSETPAPHPESPTHSLPDSFVNYRMRVQNHGPLGNKSATSKSSPGVAAGVGSGFHAYGHVGGHTGHELGDVRPQKGQVWDRSELPARFGRLTWTEEEIEAVELGGAGVKMGWGGS